jgi:hypothetical protein
VDLRMRGGQDVVDAALPEGRKAFAVMEGVAVVALRALSHAMGLDSHELERMLLDPRPPTGRSSSNLQRMTVLPHLCKRISPGSR